MKKFFNNNTSTHLTSSVDSDTCLEIMELLKDLSNQGKTIIMVTHDSDLISYATKVIRLKDGVIMEEKTNGTD